MSLALSPLNKSLEDDNNDEPLQKKSNEFDIKDINNMLKQLNVSDTPKDEEEVCIVCYNNPPDAVLMPCGHGGICYECSLSI